MTLKISGLRKSFGDLPVLDGVDLEVGRDEILALAGPSGCGKTTLLNLAAGLLRPGAGRVETGGARVGYLFQEDRLLPWLTVAENIAAAGEAAEAGEAADLIRRVGLEGFAERYPDEISGGMRQRVAMARALHFHCGLLLLDEPFKSLDPGLRLEMLDLLLAIRRERRCPILFVTHELDEALAAANRLAILSRRPARVLACLDLGKTAARRDPAAPALSGVRRRALELLAGGG
ncbi:MAG: ATP-binding cassette domain-containing protein [Planctomycetota bacterium]|jgi:NitT/TauT family transport system ATP-binding protein|nr:ATP-binding cassette domain-containing protein [Planctomycetota bacterium]